MLARLVALLDLGNREFGDRGLLALVIAVGVVVLARLVAVLHLDLALANIGVIGVVVLLGSVGILLLGLLALVVNAAGVVALLAGALRADLRPLAILSGVSESRDSAEGEDGTEGKSEGLLSERVLHDSPLL